MLAETSLSTDGTVAALPGAFLPSMIPGNGTLLIRADSSQKIGAGHIMRCVALAQEWQLRGGSCTVAASELTETTRSRLIDNGIECVDVGTEGSDFSVLADKVNPAWVVLDAGPSNHEYLSSLDEAHCVLAIDDLGGHFETSPTLLLNQNAHGPTTPYSGVSPDKLLRGLNYLLLRDEFLSEEPFNADDRDLTVLVAMGGTDPLDLLPDLISSLADSSDLKICAVASSAHPQLARLQKLDRRHSQVELHLDAPNMAQLMKRCHLALTSGGSTVWELAYMGVPSIVGATAAMERSTLIGLEEIELFETIGQLERTDSKAVVAVVKRAAENAEWLKATRVRANEVVDGAGRLRVLDRMAAILK